MQKKADRRRRRAESALQSEAEREVSAVKTSATGQRTAPSQGQGDYSKSPKHPQDTTDEEATPKKDKSKGDYISSSPKYQSEKRQSSHAIDQQPPSPTEKVKHITTQMQKTTINNNNHYTNYQQPPAQQSFAVGEYNKSLYNSPKI